MENSNKPKLKGDAKGKILELKLDGVPFPMHGILDFKPCRKKPVLVMAIQINKPFTVKTLEGTMKGNAGDYLIRGIHGEYYPCKPDIFHKTYELPDKQGRFNKLLKLLGRFGIWFFDGRK